MFLSFFGFSFHLRVRGSGDDCWGGGGYLPPGYGGLNIFSIIKYLHIHSMYLIRFCLINIIINCG